MIKEIDLSTIQGFTVNSIGLPPYTIEQYNQAKNNIVLLQNEINQAKIEGYSKVFFKTINFSICYTGSSNGEIFLEGNTEYDFGFSEIDVIYDSDNKSPFDSSQNEPFKLKGKVISFKDGASNVIIRNLKLKGDIFKRSFNTVGGRFDTEEGQEHTFGIYNGFATNNLLIDNCDIQGFMGDGVAGTKGAGAGSYNIANWGGLYLPGCYDENTNSVLPIKGAYVSNITSIDRNKLSLYGDDVAYIRRQFGYARSSVFKDDIFDVLFFDENENFINRRSVEYMEYFKIPFNAVKIRVQLFNETPDLPQIQEVYPTYTYMLIPVSRKIHIKNCKIKNNHRGGISNAGDDILIENCDILNNGSDSGIGAPIFPSTTIYGINIEDVYSNNLTILNSNITNNGRFSVAFFGKDLHIFENRLNNISIHSCENVMVCKNNMYSKSSSFNFTKGDTFNNLRNIIISDNIISCKQLYLSSDSLENTNISIKGNIIKNIERVLGNNCSNFKDNTIIFKRYENTEGTFNYITSIIIAETFDNNKILYKGSAVKGYHNIILQVSVINNCIFDLPISSSNNKNIQIFNNCSFLKKFSSTKEGVEFNTTIQNVDNHTIIFNNCIFENRGIFLPSLPLGQNSSLNVDFNNCIFIYNDVNYKDFFIKIYFNSTTNKNLIDYYFNFSKCVFKNTTNDNIKLFHTRGNFKGNVKLFDCKKEGDFNLTTNISI